MFLFLVDMFFFALFSLGLFLIARKIWKSTMAPVDPLLKAEEKVESEARKIKKVEELYVKTQGLGTSKEDLLKKKKAIDDFLK